MAKDASVEMSFWEKLGERLSGLGEGVGRFLLRLFGDSNERYVRKLGYITPRKPTESPQIIPGSLLAQVNELEPRMRALGYPSFRYRLAAFVIAGSIAGIAGSLAAMSNGYATPDLLYWTVSGLALVAVVVGGARSLIGPVLGAFAVLFGQLGLSTYVPRWELILGTLFIAFVLFVPRGLVGLVRRA